MIRVFILFLMFLTSCAVSPDTENRKVYYIQNKGATLPVIVSGANTDEIILFVHGGPGASGLFYYYSEALEKLRKRYRMVLYDQRGSGGGRGQISKKSITIDQHVDDLQVVVKSVRTLYPHAKIYLFSHSYGGMISGAYASVHQNELTGIAFLSPSLNIVELSAQIPENMINVFIDPYLARTDISSKCRSYWENARKFYKNNNPLQLDSFIEHSVFVDKADGIVGLDKLDSFFEEVLPKLIADPVLEPIILHTQIQTLIPILGKNGESFRNLENDPKFTLSKITIPTLLIVGDSDLVVPPSVSEQSFNTISSTVKTVLTYTDTAHNAILEQPTLIVNDITAFIQANP